MRLANPVASLPDGSRLIHIGMDEEGPPPGAVSGDSAGRIADIFFRSGLEYDLPRERPGLQAYSGRELVREVTQRARRRG